MSEGGERPRLITAGYGWHGSHWVKEDAPLVLAQSRSQVFFFFIPRDAVTVFGAETTGLAARPSLAPRPLHMFITFSFFARPPDRPTHLHEREGDGKRNIF